MSSRSPTEGGYRSPAAVATGELREKGSRFVAELTPARSAEEAVQLRHAIEQRHSGATHHCWAWRVGWPPSERSSDAGEPAGTAGEPILRVMRGAGVSDGLIVVARWFGGVKLGRGGLARAYAAAAGAALSTASLVDRIPTVEYRVHAGYVLMGPVRRVLASPGVNVVRQDFGERVEIEVAVEAPGVEAFEAAMADLRPEVSLQRINSADLP